jgi:hypothetical protein
MSAGFNRDRVPGWSAYAVSTGLTLSGRGQWRTTRCDIHGGSDSLRVNVTSGGWICMACGAKGGDALAHYRQVSGKSFRQAASDLGAWINGRSDHSAQVTRPARLAPSDALSALGPELTLCAVVISDARSGVIPNDTDWRRFLEAAGRVQFVASVAAAV